MRRGVDLLLRAGTPEVEIEAGLPGKRLGCQDEAEASPSRSWRKEIEKAFHRCSRRDGTLWQPLSNDISRVGAGAAQKESEPHTDRGRAGRGARNSYRGRVLALLGAFMIAFHIARE